ncbi:MAG TPA: tetratricopeptide repeat protein [Rhizomicrobium sp.]|jgi:tetratricopeptide (TPR) repeat protein
MFRKLLIGFVVAVMAGGAARAADAPARFVTIRGSVENLNAIQDQIRFTMGPNIWFTIIRSHVADPDGLLAALQGAASGGHTAAVRVDVTAGWMDPSVYVPVFLAHDVLIDGKTLAGDPIAGPDDAGLPPLEQAERETAQAAAYMAAMDDETARHLLDAALQQPDLPAGLKAYALQTRGAAESDEAQTNVPPGPERDQLLLAALKDYRDWQAAAPNDISPISMQAGVLLQLGAYDEGLALYRANYDKQPKLRFWNRIMTESAYREKGDLPKALETLDQLAATSTETLGMSYYYHRGRVLYAMGRYDDAAAALAAGLTLQPDYVWAHAYRACSLAQTGRLDEAVAMQRLAVDEHAAQHIDAVPSLSLTTDSTQLAAVLAQLQAEDQKDPHTQLGDLCGGYWNFGFSHREHTALALPQP